MEDGQAGYNFNRPEGEVIYKGWFDEFETGLNIIIAIVQKV